MTAARKRKSLVADEWGALSDEMRALPNAKWRGFVEHFLLSEPGYGAATAAARSAGFGKPNSSALTMAQIASRLLRDPRVVGALAAESKKLLRAGAPEATKALMALIGNPEHRDHGRAIGLVLARVDPEVAKHDINVVHRIGNPDEEALEELNALRTLGTSREKLIELFGGNGLARLEKLEAADIVKRADAAKVIEGEAVHG
jgi:phage terminase small subunit